MLAYALAFKPCSEVTDIGSILSWGSVFWRDLVRIRRIQDFPEYQLGVKGMKLGVQSYGRIWGFYGVTVGGEGAGVQVSSVFCKPKSEKIVIGSPNSFFYLFSCLFDDNNLLFRCKKYKIKP